MFPRCTGCGSSYVEAVDEEPLEGSRCQAHGKLLAGLWLVVCRRCGHTAKAWRRRVPCLRCLYEKHLRDQAAAP